MKTKKAKITSFALCVAILLFTLAPLIAFFASTTSTTSTTGTTNGPTPKGTGGLVALWQLVTAPGTLRSLSFSLSQAFMSSLLALLIGLPGAYFVAKYKFPGRRLLLALSAVPFCLPPVLVILSFVLFYGKAGWMTKFLQALGISFASNSGGFLYGFWGLVFVHAFYNFPIVIQNVGKVWEQLPSSREEAARTLGAKRFEAFKTGALPYLLPSILQSMSLVFLFCFFSFTIVLVFGSLAGSTLEVDIYRALRFSGDRQRASVLAALQTLIALAVAWALARFGQRNSAIMRDFGQAGPRKNPNRLLATLIALYAVFIGIFFIGPLAALAVEAFSVSNTPGAPVHFGFENFARLLNGRYAQSGNVLGTSLANSLVLSGIAALLAIGIGLTVALAITTRGYSSVSPGKPLRFGRYGTRPNNYRSTFSTVLTNLPMAISPALTAFGWAILSGTVSASDRNMASNVAIIIGQSTIAWPFVAKSVSAALQSLDPQKHDAARTLGASPLKATFLVDLAEIWPSLLSAAAFAFSMTIGDSNIALVVGGGRDTLPILVYRLTSAYRFNEACAAGIVLAVLTGIAFFFKERPYGRA
jgi:thiamine transport system permease protein